ncbi:response regulator transcription factor [Paraburkholderia sp. D15]|uniref:response regulator transcription factor n=1 Tax=Paraburkholderia sp. D15 TaxID=2880218 RepID=UPI00247A00C7|nr:response regulator transcription factor [Paraburkholderia sp. D15]WGS50362.1 response regulator transcription factor [Paraburkholderia sp. D15]WKF58269.1 Transcriptional regulatory protein RcsB [Paraburkholderia busanensis]
MKRKIRVIVADDHDCVRVGVQRLLRAAPHIEVVGEAADTYGLAELLDARACDVVVSDVSMPGIDGGSNAVSFLRRLLRGRPHPCVVVLTMICHAHMLSGLLHIGVGAIVDKRDVAGALIEAIEASVAGRVFLSEQARVAMETSNTPVQLGAGVLSAREWEVFQLYVQGHAVHEIATRLQRSGKTISTQKRSAMRKLGLETESDLIDYARQIGLT